MPARGLICLDIETEPFSESFRSAKTPEAKQKFAPKMRVACAYVEAIDDYVFFTEDNVADLLVLVQGANEVVTFNGKGFDILLLRKHYGLRGKVPSKGKHTDLHEILTSMSGFRVSLDKASWLNLKEKKHTAGREMANLDLHSLKEACKSDVIQTYRLWQLHNEGELKAPERTPREFGRSEWIGGPGHHMPDICPECHDAGSVEFVESDIEEMTDGQFAEYMAGTQGIAVCNTCNSIVAWNV